MRPRPRARADRRASRIARPRRRCAAAWSPRRDDTDAVTAVVCLPTYNELDNRLAAEFGYVDVLHRERKEGLGRAYLAGFRRALEGDAELILEMDCDFSHDP